MNDMTATDVMHLVRQIGELESTVLRMESAYLHERGRRFADMLERSRVDGCNHLRIQRLERCVELCKRNSDFLRHRSYTNAKQRAVDEYTNGLRYEMTPPEPPRWPWPATGPCKIDMVGNPIALVDWEE